MAQGTKNTDHLFIPGRMLKVGFDEVGNTVTAIGADLTPLETLWLLERAKKDLMDCKFHAEG